MRVGSLKWVKSQAKAPVGVRLGSFAAQTAGPVYTQEQTSPHYLVGSGLCCLPDSTSRGRARYSIFSSASPSSVGGIVSPNSFAALSLMIIWDLVGCITPS